ncbi:MAG: hypothetical protein JWR15_879, partial [Prosthecobacter sp.]|nr:hypothetical protein [Prosthecobacter sp.]
MCLRYCRREVSEVAEGMADRKDRACARIKIGIHVNG